MSRAPVFDAAKELATLIHAYCSVGGKNIASTATTKKKKKSNKRSWSLVQSTSFSTTAIVDSSSSTSPELVLEKIKQACKTSSDGVLLAHRLLFERVKAGKSSMERTRALTCIDELFCRSSKFRANSCDSLSIILDGAFGDDVPGPNAGDLRRLATSILRKWYNQHGQHYPQLLLALQSQQISIVAEDSENREEELQRAMDQNFVNSIIRGFQIYDGAVLFGSGVAEAETIDLAYEKIIEMQQCLVLLLPFLNTFDDSDDNSEEEKQVSVIETDDAPKDEMDKRTSLLIDDAFNEESDIEWETESFQEQAPGPLLPNGYHVDLSFGVKDEQESMTDVRETLSDSRTVIERRVLPELRQWSSVLERVIGEDPQNQTRRNVLLRVKSLLSEVGQLSESCERLEIQAKKARLNQRKLDLF